MVFRLTSDRPMQSAADHKTLLPEGKGASFATGDAVLNFQDTPLAGG